MLTVRQLSDELGLPLLAGGAGLDAPVRWVHISELPDPTPWLSGGELLLATGDRIGDGVGYVERLADYGVAGMALGLGVEGGLQEVPPAMLTEAEARGFPLLEVPLPMPFLAITERAATHLVNEGYAALQRAMAAVEELQRVALGGAGPEGVARALSEQLGAPVRLEPPGGDGRPVGDPAQATLVVDGADGEFDRLLLRQAIPILALELLRARVAADTERRLAGDVLDSILSGDLRDAELRRRLAPFGLRDQVAAIVLDSSDEAALHAALRAETSAGIAARAGELCCALVPGGDGDVVALAQRLCERVPATLAGVGRPVDPVDARRAFHQARFALEARRLGGGSGVATSDDLGSFQLLLSLQDDDALRLFCDSVLEPLDEGGYAEELVRSLEAYIESNGSWERAARALDVHRHTLRYRVRRIEELTGRSLDSARDRIDFWLALRGRELLS